MHLNHRSFTQASIQEMKDGQMHASHNSQILLCLLYPLHGEARSVDSTSQKQWRRVPSWVSTAQECWELCLSSSDLATSYSRPISLGKIYTGFHHGFDFGHSHTSPPGLRRHTPSEWPWAGRRRDLSVPVTHIRLRAPSLPLTRLLFLWGDLAWCLQPCQQMKQDICQQQEACIKHRDLFRSRLYGHVLHRRRLAGIHRNQVPDMKNLSRVTQSLLSKAGPFLSSGSHPRCHLCQEAFLDYSANIRTPVSLPIIPPCFPFMALTIILLLCIFVFYLSLPIRL